MALAEAGLTAGVPDFVREAEGMLRDGSLFEWHTVAFIGIVMYVYAVEVERRRWDIVLAGLAFWTADWLNEIVNSLVLHFSDRAPLWTVTGDTSYLILIGLAIEISFLFAISGIVFVKSLPPDPATRILGIPNRWAIALAFSLLAVFVEVLINDAGHFHWEYWWWDFPFVALIVVFGYLWFFVFTFKVYDMGDTRRQVRAVGALAAVDATAIVVFGPVLGWI